MTKTVKIFLPKEFHEELLYQYEDKDADLRKVVFGFLKPLAKQGKMVLLNKMLTARVMENGKMSMKDFELKDIDLQKYAVPFNDSWIPEKVTREEINTYSLTISDRLFDDLCSFAEIFCARYQLYNDSITDPKKDKPLDMPACFEQIIQDNVVSQLSNTIASNIDKEYDEEFSEMEKTIKTKAAKAEGPKRNSPKK